MVIGDCRIFVQIENCYDPHQHIPVARYEEKLFIVEACNDLKLQPVVVMKKLNDARYFSARNFLS